MAAHRWDEKVFAYQVGGSAKTARRPANALKLCEVDTLCIEVLSSHYLCANCSRVAALLLCPVAGVWWQHGGVRQLLSVGGGTD